MKLRCTTRHRGLAALAALVFVLGCDGSRSEPTRVATDALRLSAALEPAEGRIGENQIWIELEDAEGRPIPGADLRVKVNMAAMGAMPAMGGAASVQEVGEGRYRADFELDMGGTWSVEVEVPRPEGETQRFQGSLSVGTPGLRLRAEGRTDADAAGREASAGAAPDRHPAEISVDPGRLQTIGVRTTSVKRTEVGMGIRTLGRVVYDETQLADVSPKIRGWIETLEADAVGLKVNKGEVLFTVYSPELYAAQEELLQALRSRGTLSDSLVRAAENRLRLWGVSRSDIDRIEKRGEPLEALPVRAPTSGYLIEKNVVEGSSIVPGQRLMRIAPLDRVWIEVDLYEEDLRLVRVGQSAEVTLSHLPGRAYVGKVTFLYPFLAGETRTARARIELDNPDLVLRPDMFANVELRSAAREALVVPESAVLYAGDRQFVFLALGGGHFRPQAVEVGVRKGDQIEIVSGLQGDEEVVSSGTFLIASESRLRAALDQW
jgi:Cu(I)/Ag(I) efflux system membrane fusion protein